VPEYTVVQSPADQGYLRAKRELRDLLKKVPEKKQLGVVLAWLHEGDGDGRA